MLRITLTFLLLFTLVSARQPNVVLILADDLGYADLGCFGSKTIQTPHLDRLAADGVKGTSFYVSQAVCSASRASLMTGCYANRVGMQGALNHTSEEGLNPMEWTLPEMLKEKGYATAAFGKWHLGTRMIFHPMKNGFDEFLGIPYSNDNSRYHPSLAKEMPPLPLYDGLKVIETDPDQSFFTQRFTERAVNFIERHRAEPFFLYVPHVMPHVPIFASKKWRGKSGAGLYADVVQELDDSVGQIVDAVSRCGLAQDTLILFFSDNGPFLSYGNHAGSAKPLREGKLTSFEGGVRVPFIARWSGRLPAGRECTEPMMETDLLPTLAALSGGKLPQQKIDGMNILPVLDGGNSPHEAFYFYSGDELQAVRRGVWKLHFAHSYISVEGEPGHDGKPARYGLLQPKSITHSGIDGIATRHGYVVKQQPLALYDLSRDPGEVENVAEKRPEIVEKLKKLATGMRSDLGDALTKTQASGARAVGREH
ncbi:MAG: sulfatase [Prosthecobacter sp.]